MRQGRIEEALRREWLLTNHRGAFSSSTIIGCPTRKYHGLLIAPLRPPLERHLLLAGMIEHVSHGEDRVDLSTFEFPGALHPEGHRLQTGFESCPGDAHPWVRFTYRHGSLDVSRRITLSRLTDVVRVDYQVRAPDRRPLRLEVSPLIAMRDLHGLRHQAAEDPWTLQATESGLWVSCRQAPELTLAILGWSGAELTQPQLALDPVWWHNFRYRIELERGYAGGEDLQSAGTFQAEGRGTLNVSIHAVAYPPSAKKARSLAREAFKDEPRADRGTRVTSTDDPVREALMTAADQFVVSRAAPRGKKSGTTILAGYPWFGDWGRDAFISLEGLLLIPGRFSEAREVLATFAAVQRNGLIPNRFDDYGGDNAYNSVDASLWFVHAAEAYLRHSADAGAWDGFLKKACLSVIRHYVEGTDFGIGVDPRGLVRCGDDSMQLTWMDAKVGDTPVTPRAGCPVEVNALWYSILKGLASRMGEGASDDARLIGGLIDQIEKHFAPVFWNETDGCLFDFVSGDRRDAAIRPNQIFAVGLPYSPLGGERQKAVVDVVRSHLLTPYGLRTLSQKDSRYRGACTGSAAERDRAYHNGTVWPWLIGRFIEAFLRVNNSTESVRQEARTMLAPLIEHLDQECLGSVSEIFDGDPPHQARGCYAQAWSVAELLRAYDMTSP
jgi:predicted glycogen debranching enzyme